MEDRVRGLEIRVQALETGHAVRDERDKSIDTRLHSIEDTLKWLTRLIIGGIIMAAVAFVIAGGLQV